MPNTPSKAVVGDDENAAKDEFETRDSMLHESSRGFSPSDSSTTGNASDYTNEISELREEESSNSFDEEFQDFRRLKKECLLKNKLFEDPKFPAKYSSIYTGRHKIPFELGKDVEWLRPRDIMKLRGGGDPQFFVDGYSRFDANQGSLADCWLIAAIANLAMHPKLFTRVVPENQDFGKEYAGIFHFRFWKNQKWVDVVIDDLLPTNVHGKLIFAQSTVRNEFWGALVEKAYAKLHGSWDDLWLGFIGHALMDLTGGSIRLYHMNLAPPELFTILLEAQEKNALMGLTVLEPEEKKLVQGHVYSITRVHREAEFELLRLRNPWGTGEWTGPWSDESPKWDVHADKKLREKLDLVVDDDGEFWIPFDLAKLNSSQIEICYLN